MIEYICKNQNDPVYAHLFTYNLVDLIMKDVRCDQLFNSKILNMAINFYEWPSLNHDNERCFAPFNDSMFNIRFAYPGLFKDKYD